MNRQKIILGIYVAAFVAVGLSAFGFFVEMHRDLKLMEAQEASNQHRLAEAQKQLAAQEKYLEQLRHDPALIERLIRQKLGYAKTQEFVFRFEDGP